MPATRPKSFLRLRQLARLRRQAVPAEVTATFPDGGSIKIVTSVAQAWTQAELADQIDRLAGLVSAHALTAGGAARIPQSPADADAR